MDSGSHIHLDALLVGGGFNGVYQLKRLCDEGYNVKLVDNATTWGGVWYWNRYSGARVDSAIPHYEFSAPELWQEWRWSQRFPGSEEIRNYFQFVARKWDLDRNAIFSITVTDATWDQEAKKWHVRTDSDKIFTVKYLLLNTGISAKRHVPDWPGKEKFKGTFPHPSYWPKEEPDLSDKKVAVIGTGATGIQLAQEMGERAKEFVLFQRTPNTCLPMKQIAYPGNEQSIPWEEYPDFFINKRKTFSGFDFNFLSRKTFEDSAEQRRQTYEDLWARGDFHFWVATYSDMLFDEVANQEAYNFWKIKVRSRLQDPRLQDLLAPHKQPHAFGCKRISLENGFYEIFSRPNVSLVDLKTEPIVELTEKGIKTSTKEYDFDYIICATGYDAVTGGIKNIRIAGTGGRKLADEWDKGVKTYLGMCVSGFPNLFFTHGPQAPTALCNGPTCAEIQGEWIVQLINDMHKDAKTKIEARAEDEEKWIADVWRHANASLLPKTKSWYMGDNIPGKPREPLLYLGGADKYYQIIEETARRGYLGFDRT